MDKKPNIVYFFCDELQTNALGCYSGYKIKNHTPNIDGISENGVKFSNCYCNSPLCVPSRTSILTGLYPNDTGVLSNEAALPNYNFENKYITLPEHFEKYGYVTANFGKTHLPQTMHPFQIDNGEGGDMRFIRNVQEDKLNLIKPAGFPTLIGGIYPDSEEYLPNKVAENAVEFINNTDKSFFLRVSFLQPHTPVVPINKIVKEYKNLNLEDVDRTPIDTCEFEKKFANIIGAKSLSEEQVKNARIYYYALVHWVDIQVGKVMDALKATNNLDNTIIVFNADHGVSLGESGLYAKHIFAPSVHKVPLIISYPQKLKPGTEDKICSNIDIAKTLCRLAGLSVPQQFKGIDLFSDEENDYIYSVIGYGLKESCAFPYKSLGKYSENEGWPMRCCVRTKRYRLDKNVQINGKRVNKDSEDIFFTNCQKEPQEKVNMKDYREYKQVLDKLNNKLDEFIK